MSYLNGLRNFCILMIILFSVGFIAEQAKIIGCTYSDNATQNEMKKQTQEPFTAMDFEASSAENITELSSWDENYGAGIGSVTYNQFSIIITPTQGLIVVDKTNPSNPILITIWDDNQSVANSYFAFDIRESYLYLLDDRGQVTIVNISNIMNFELVSITMVEFSVNIKIHEDLLFIFGSSQFQIYNITIPGSMVFIESYSNAIFFVNHLTDVEIINQTAYFVGDYGLQIYNITDLHNFAKIGNTTAIHDSVYNYKISVKNNLAFIGTLNYGIVIYNITNQINPIFMYSILNETTNYYYSNWYFIDVYLLVYNRFKELILCDASNITDIQYLQTTELSLPLSIEKYQDTLIITSANKYTYIANISNLLDITIIGKFDNGGYSVGVCAYGNFVFLANGGSGLDIISVANPNNPVKVGNAFLDSYASGVCVSNDIAFVACFTDGVYIIDVSNPLEPIILTKYSSPSGHHFYFDLVIKENLLYIANGNGGVEIVDVSIPGSPVLLNDFNLENQFVQAIDIQDNLAFAVDGIYEFAIYDISSPVHPSHIRSIKTYNWIPREVVAEGDYVYVLDYANGFSIVDIEKPYDPEIVLDYYIGSFYYRHIAIWGEYVYLTNSYDGLFVIDCFDIDSPVLIQRYDNNDLFFEIFTYNSYVYVANSYNGLLIFGANKTKINGYEIPLVAFITTVSLMTCLFYKNKKRKRKKN